jgi:Mg-chelatase subunit ChlD
MEEARVRAEIRAAEERIASIRRQIAERDRQVAEARAPWEAAKARFEQAQAARDRAERDLEAFKATLAAATRALDERIARAEAERDESKRALDADHNNSSKRNEFIANTYACESLYRQRDRILERHRAEDRLRSLKEAVTRTIDPYWDARREFVHAASDYDIFVRLREELEGELAGSEAGLALIRLTAAERLTGLEPPHLVAVEAKSGGATVYKASWKPAIEVIDERIDFMRRAVAFQESEIRRQTERRDEWLELFQRASDEVQAKIAAYEDAIYSQCLKSIAVELGDAAVSVALDWKEMGPYAVVWQAVEKTLDAATHDISDRYSLPASTGSVPPPFSSASVQEWCTDAAIDRYKTVVKALLEGAAGGEWQPAGHYASRRIGRHVIRVPSISQAEMWVLVRRAAMDPNGFGMVLLDAAGRPRYANEALNMLRRLSTVDDFRAAFRQYSPSEAAASFRSRLRTWDFWRNAGRGVAIDVVKDLIKSAAHDAAKAERLQVWEEYLEADAYALAVLRQLQLESAMRRAEIVQQKAYAKYLQELQAERNAMADDRLKDVEADEPATTDEIELTLTFSREVIEPRAALAGVEVAMNGGGRTWTGRVTIDRTGANTAQLSVTAKDALSQKPLDADPSTMARQDATRDAWTGVESGSDETHAIRLRSGEPGVSMVVLLDLSGSMNDSGRLESAKAGVAAALAPGNLSPNTEVALWTFSGSSCQLVVPFTSEPHRVVDAVRGLRASGDTPLARAIVASGRYLVTHARNDRKLLLVFSDGLDTEGGNVGAAARRVQGMGADVEGLR